ncbi:MAG TPA: geranylgeranyl reductase family protein [Firmicutes bacterium]|nr:geranylgeranyl reductase family protein [Bacillota bacterium]HHY97420.1 geranylgeranyl reductase family protein [Bacillota bacterium]
MDIWDLVVIGAGPAGSSAARVAANLGLRVLLIDKARFPRDKRCAGGVSRKALAAIPEPLPGNVIEREITSLILGGPGDFLIQESTGAPIAVTVRRSVFDSFLVDLAIGAGAEFRDNTEVLDLDEHEGFVSISLGNVPRAAENVRASFVIGADGAQGKVAALSGIRRKWRRIELGVGLYIETTLGKAPPEAMHLYCLPELPCSFGWMFPYRDSANVGIGTWGPFSSRIPPVFHSFLERLKTKWGIRNLSQCRKRYILPAGGFTRRIAKSRILLAGDAAGMVDPFSGEGIYYAIKSGAMAAETVARAIRSYAHPADIAMGYQRLCYSHFIKEFRLSAIRAFTSGYKNKIGFWFLRHDPRIAKRLIDIITGGT